MHIFIKNKKLILDKYRIKCAIGKRGIGNKKREGDKITPIGKFKMTVMQNKPEAQQEWPKVKKYIDKMFKDINLKKIKDEQQLLAVLDKTAKGMKV